MIPGGDPGFGPGRPLPVDLVIVDESSMLNLRLAEVLLEGLAETTHVVFVGDADQLPPIGAGKPFEDLIEFGRGAAGAAHPDLPPGGPLDDHHRRPRDQPRPSPPPRAGPRPGPRLLHRATGAGAGTADGGRGGRRAGRRTAGVEPIREVQTLAPMYKGPVGIDALNERLQERLNPDGKRAVGDRFRWATA